MRKLWICLMMFGIGPVAWSDVHYADSPEFQLNLSSFPSGGLSYHYAESQSFELNLLFFPSGGGTYAVAEWPAFSLDLHPINRVWADSGAFDFNYLANTDPNYAQVTRQNWPDNSERLQELYYNNQEKKWLWQPITFLPPKDTTVFILNHGWNDSPEGDMDDDNIPDNDIRDLAIRIVSLFPENAKIKIYSWDWGDGPYEKSDANPNGKPGSVDAANLVKYVSPLTTLLNWDPLARKLLGDKDFIIEVDTSWYNSMKHGFFLGQRMAQIGLVPRDYPIHMIGHSFGGVVSANAASFLYSNSYGKIRQLTTIDTPALPLPFPYAVAAINPNSAERVEVLYYQWIPDIVGLGFGGPVPFPTENVLNLHLMPGHYPFILDEKLFTILHNRAVEWYIDSINSTADCDPSYYGFNWSFASPKKPSVLPTGTKAEDFFNQGCVVDILPVAAVKTVAKEIKRTWDGLESLVTWTGDKVVAAGEWVKGNYISFATITTSISIAPSDPDMPIPPDGEDQSAGISKRFLVPADADTLSIDVRFRQVSPGDWLTIALDGKIAIYIDAATEGASSDFKTYSTSISEYAEKEVMLQITLESNTPQSTIADLNNLRFTEATITADINEDGTVDVLDLIAMSEYWAGPVYAPGDASDKADINGDKKIDLLDLAELADSWLWKNTADPIHP